jgi:predicted nucleic acid-binding protein
MRKLVVDTSLIIDFLRRKDKANSLLYQLAEEDLSVSIITHTELYAGKSVWENDEAKEILEKVLSGMTLISLNEKISQKAGYIKSNTDISLIDAIIAATALVSNMAVVTLNIKDFKIVKGLKIVNS